LRNFYKTKPSTIPRAPLAFFGKSVKIMLSNFLASRLSTLKAVLIFQLEGVKMTIVYCDVCDRDKNNICAWGCVIIHNRAEYIFSGYSLDNEALQHGNFYAIIKSLEMLSQFDVKDVRVYTEEETVVSNFNAISKGAKIKFKGGYAGYFKRLCEFALKYNLVLLKIQPDQNRAHHIANFTLRNTEVSLPEAARSKPLLRKKKVEKSPLTIIKSCIPKQLKVEGDFNFHIRSVISHSAKQKGFSSLLSENGVSMSSFYQLLKNRFPKKIMYKQNGEKKLHMAFARALQGSEFCVCEISGLYYIFYCASRPDSAQVVDCDNAEIQIDDLPE
jgi:hypothetical protein